MVFVASECPEEIKQATRSGVMVSVQWSDLLVTIGRKVRAGLIVKVHASCKWIFPENKLL